MAFDPEFPKTAFLRLADATTEDIRTPSDQRKQEGDADRLFVPVVWRKLLRVFTPKGIPFFQFYIDLYKVQLGLPYDGNLKQDYKRAADRIITVVSPFDKQSLSPTAVNHIALTRPLVNRVLNAINQGHVDDPANWARFNAVFVPVLVEVAKDKGVYLAPTHQQGRERWAQFRLMSSKQERIERLRDDDPEAFVLMQQKGQAIKEINEGIRAQIEADGKEVKQSFLAGRPVLVGVDKATGEEHVYDLDGEVVPKAAYFDKVRQKTEARAALSRVPQRTQVNPSEVRLLDDKALSQLEGEVMWSAITDDKAKQSRLTRILPTKWTRKFIATEEKLRVEGYKVVVEGRYKGVFLDDLINSEGRLIEGTAYSFNPRGNKTSRVPQKMDPSEREPYVSVAEVVEQRTFQGKKITLTKQKLYIKINGTRQSKVLRDALKSLACNTGTQRGCIPSVVYEGVEGSNAAGFYFEPNDFGLIMQSLQGMSLSTEALKIVQDYYQDLARAEAATKNLTPYTPEALASETEAGEKFQFITGSRRPHTGEWEPFDLRQKQQEALAWMDANGNTGVCALDTGLGKCVREDTLILTNQGLVPIRGINPGVTEPDTTVPVEGWSVLIHGETLPIKSFYYGGLRSTIKVRTRRGYEVEGSRIHPLLVRTPDGRETWVKTPDLSAGDFLCLERKEARFSSGEPKLAVPTMDEIQQRSKNPDVIFTNGHLRVFPVPNQMSPDMGRLLGYIVAEGWTNSREAFYISQCPEKNPEVRADIETLLLHLLGVTANPEKDIRVYSVFLREYLLRMGVDLGLAKDKVIPEVILRSSKETVRQFIRGLVDAEGYADTNPGRAMLEFSTASEQMSRELQVLLLCFGVVSSRHPKKVKGYNHIYWRLTITGQDAVTYQQVIGFVSDRKIAASEDVPSTRNSNLDVVPHLAHAVGDLFDAMLSALNPNVSAFRHQVQGGSASFHNTVNHIRLGRRNPTYPFLQRMLSLATDAGCQGHSSFQTIVGVLNRHFFYDPIENMIESEAVVMDIEVDDPRHCFVGNGVMNHNTAVSIGMMLKLVRDGLAEPDSSYTRPDGKTVQTNGRFLFVCMTSLKGNIKKEIRNLLSDPSVMTAKLDVLSYNQFVGASRSKKVPTRLQSVPFWKAVTVWDPALYAAIFFDEAQAMKDPASERSQAALKLYHPRKICLTASPMERNPMEAYVLAAISNNIPLFGRTLEAQTNRNEMRRFKERFCEVVGGRIVGVKQDPLIQRDLHTWVKRNIFYADKTDVAEYHLPKPEVQVTPVYMSEPVESLYRDVAGQFSTIMQGAARKFGERTRGDAYADRQAERIFSKALAPIIKLLTDMSNRPAQALQDIAYAIEKGTLPGYEDEGKPLPKSFLALLQKWAVAHTPDNIRALAASVGNPKIKAAEDTLASRLEAVQGSRSLLFADDKALCLEAGEHLARTLAGTHVVALNDVIHFYRGGRALNVWVYPLDQDMLARLHPDEGEQQAILSETGGLTMHALPFVQKSYKRHPTMKGRQGVNQVYEAAEWQQFVLKEIVNPDPTIVTCTLFGKVYMYGHNLQGFNTVIHLDRNNWNSESMKQRVARAWRQGQTEVVQETTLDHIYQPDHGGVERSEFDKTLDEIRASFQNMDAAIFDRIIKDAQTIALGAEWAGVEKKDASLWRLDEQVAELMASPFMGRARPPGTRA